MNKIKIGDQVKTTRGYLGRVVALKENGVVLDVGMGMHIRCSLDNCKKIGAKKNER